MHDAWQRHDLLRVEPQAWARVLRSHPRLSTVPHAARWAALGWPLIVRRAAEEDLPGMIPVAFPLPPACGKLRVAARIAPEDVSEKMPTQTLRRVREEMPRAWQPVAKRLLELADETGVEPRVFGSLLWQTLTGMPYLSKTSDLDLLWPVPDAACATRLVCRLTIIETGSPVRIDGEIILPDGGGVQWREWYGNSTEVLVKTLSGVKLRAKRDLFTAATCVV